MGLVASEIESWAMGSKLGFKNGDIVQSINGISIDSREKLLEVAQRFGNASNFRVGILRDGKPRALTIRLE